MIASIGRRLPHRTQRDVAEVVEVLVEIWSNQLAQGQVVSIPDVGKLSIEVQDMRADGALRHRGRLRRVYGRFRPTQELKERIQEVGYE